MFLVFFNEYQKILRFITHDALYLVIALVSVNIMFNVIGQLFLKYGMNKLGNFKISLDTLLPVFIKAFLSPYILLRAGLLRHRLSHLAHCSGQGRGKLCLSSDQPGIRADGDYGLVAIGRKRHLVANGRYYCDLYRGFYHFAKLTGKNLS